MAKNTDLDLDQMGRFQRRQAIARESRIRRYTARAERGAGIFNGEVCEIEPLNPELEDEPEACAA